MYRIDQERIPGRGNTRAKAPRCKHYSHVQVAVTYSVWLEPRICWGVHLNVWHVSSIAVIVSKIRSDKL